MNLISKRLATIDGLRFIAVMSVLIFHVSQKRLVGGFMGVDVFYIISGYVVLNSILRKYQEQGTFSWQRFLLARARRLLLPLALLVVLIAGYTALLKDRVYAGILRQSLLATLFYIANWNEIFERGNYFFVGWVKPTKHFWSLGVEEQFYFFITVLSLVALARAKRPQWIRAAFCMIFVGSIWRFLQLYASGVYITRIYMGTDTRAFQIALGALLVFLPRPRRKIPTWLFSLSMGVLLMGMMVLFGVVKGTDESYFTWGIFLIMAISAVLIYLMTIEDECMPSLPSRLLQTRVVQVIGLAAYEIYLWHVFVMSLLNEERAAYLGVHSLCGRAVLQGVVSLILGILTYFGFSQRLSRALARRPLGVQVKAFTAIFLTSVVIVLGATHDWQARPDYLRPVLANSSAGWDAYVFTLGNSVQRGIFPVFRQEAEQRGLGAISTPGDLSCASLLVTSKDPRITSNYHCVRSFRFFLDRTLQEYPVTAVILFETYWFGHGVEIWDGTRWLTAGEAGYFTTKVAALRELSEIIARHGAYLVVVYLDAPAVVEQLETPQDVEIFERYVTATASFTRWSIVLNRLPCPPREATERVICAPLDLSYRDHIHLDDRSKPLLARYVLDLLESDEQPQMPFLGY